MRWDYPLLDINPVFSGLGEIFIIFVIVIILFLLFIITVIIIVIIIIIINIITLFVKQFYGCTVKNLVATTTFKGKNLNSCHLNNCLVFPIFLSLR